MTAGTIVYMDEAYVWTPEAPCPFTQEMLMTDQTQPIDPPFEGSTEKVDAPAPKPRKRAAKKAPAAPEPEPSEPSKSTGGTYLPALPEGYAYTRIDATGPNGEDVGIEVHSADNIVMSFTGAGLTRSNSYPTVDLAIKGLSQAAKNMAKVAARRAELERLEAEALEL